MRLLLALLISLPAFAGYVGLVTAKLDVGTKVVIITNSGPTSVGTFAKTSPAGWARSGFAISTIYVPPTPTDAAALPTCADPCGVSINREHGQQYYWFIRLNSDGTVYSPFTMTAVGAAYTARQLGSLGTIPMVEPAVVTTSPLHMPLEVIGQDGHVTRTQVPLISGHASTSLRLWTVLHASSYFSTTRWDGKVSVQVNSGAWLTYSNDNASLVCDDELSYYSLATGSGDAALYDTKYKIGGYAQVRVCQMDLVNGTIGSGDTTATIGWRFNGTEGQGSGYHVLAFSIVEADKTITDIAVTSNVATASVTSHGYSSGDNVVIRNAPGMYMRFSGQRALTGVATNTFTFAPCGTGNPACTSPNKSSPGYRVPVNLNPVTYAVTTQEVTYVARAIIAKTSFTQEDPSTWTAPAGSDATRGGKLFKFGNAAGTGGQLNQLMNPVTPDLDYKFKYATCGGAAGCHTFTGRDLKYINMSNKALKERTIFHGFTDQDGDDIAAYIRSLPDPVYPNARPWNPPFQPGPGLDAGTFKKSDSTLTSIVVSSNLGTFTVPGGHGYVTGQPVITSGATVDTDLNKQCLITVSSSTVFTCPTVSVANGTYSESTLKITSSDKVLAGCGWECMVNDGYDSYLEYLAPSGSTTNWALTTSVNTLILPIPWLLPDYKFWLAQVHPADAFPLVDYFADACYTSHASHLAGGGSAITPGDFTSYKAAGYALADYDACVYYKLALATAYGFPGQSHLPDGSAGNIKPSIHPLFWNGQFGRGMMDLWELWHEYSLMALDGQRQVDTHGAATATGCFDTWGIPTQAIFNNGPHKAVMAYTGVFDGMRATYDYASNLWYILGTIISFNNCWDSPNNPIDNAYYAAFLHGSDSYRPTGFAAMLTAQIVVPQLGRQRPVLYNYTFNGSYTTSDGTHLTWVSGNQWDSSVVGQTGHFNATDSVITTFTDATHIIVATNVSIASANYIIGGGEGTDWTAVWSNIVHYNDRAAIQWYSSSQLTALANYNLDQINNMYASHSTAYWQRIVTLIGNTSPSAAAAASGSSGLLGDVTAYVLTMFKIWGGDSGKLATMKAYGAAIWPAHDWNADEAAATQGDISNGATGDLSSPGTKTITFTSCPCTRAGGGCDPPMRLVISGGTGATERKTPSGGTCVLGNAGTLIVGTDVSHTGGWTAKFGCFVGNQSQNYDFGNPAVPPFWACSNFY